MKKLLITILLFITLSILFVYPSFYTFTPIDCIAGCRGTKGLPFTYYEFHGSGIIIPGQKTNYTEIDNQNLILDLAIWLIVSVTICNIAPNILRKTRRRN